MVRDKDQHIRKLERENERLKALVRRLTRALFANGMPKADIEAVFMEFDLRKYGVKTTGADRNGG